MNLAKLKGLRAEHNYTQKDMAEKLGLTPQSFYQKETGKREFTASEVFELCKIFNVQPSIFFDE